MSRLWKTIIVIVYVAAWIIYLGLLYQNDLREQPELIKLVESQQHHLFLFPSIGGLGQDPLELTMVEETTAEEELQLEELARSYEELARSFDQETIVEEEPPEPVDIVIVAIGVSVIVAATWYKSRRER